MKSSFKNRTYNFLQRYKNRLLFKFDTYIMYSKSWLQDFYLGNGCKFMGVANFNVGNGGSIRIGDNCIFISLETENRIGLSHRCVVTASPYDEEKGCNILIGNNCGFSGTSIWCFSKIVIGNNVRCGANTLIMDGDAHFDDPRTSPPKPIIIKDNVFLGANVVVKKGVTIGKNSIIGMNSIVTKDIPENSIAVGNPCKVIKKITL